MIRSFFLSLCCALGLGSMAQAQHYNIEGVARLDILPGYPTVEGHMSAIHIQLRPGWKTYWRAPGSTGIAPAFDWSGSKNLEAVKFHWPEPSVFVQNGIRVIGYENELILPIGVAPHTPGQPISLQGNVRFGVCDDVCLLVNAGFSRTFVGTDSHSQSLIKAALLQQPQSGKSAGIHSATCQISRIEDGFRLTTTLQIERRLSAQTFTVFEFPNPDIWIEQNPAHATRTTIRASANLYTQEGAPLFLERSKISLMLLGGPRAIELPGCPE